MVGGKACNYNATWSKCACLWATVCITRMCLLSPPPTINSHRHIIVGQASSSGTRFPQDEDTAIMLTIIKFL